MPLSDGAGRIVAVGDGVDPSLAGELVVPSFFQHWRSGRFPPDALTGALGGPLDGVLQERILLDAGGVVAAPKGWSAPEASTLPCAAITAWGAVAVLARTRPGDVVVVEGTGGVACFAVQFAHLCGAHVVVVSSSDAKLEAVQRLGADTLINYRRTPQWGKAVRAAVGRPTWWSNSAARTRSDRRSGGTAGGTIALIGVLSGWSGRATVGRRSPGKSLSVGHLRVTR